MRDMRDMRDIAHLGHVELLTPTPQESLWFFRDVLGMHEVARDGQSVFLRAWGEYELCSLKLTESAQPGISHTAFRVSSPQALERLAQSLEAGGHGRGWIEGDVGHGKAFQFTDPDGHLLEVYYETEKYRAPEDQRPALKNQPQRTPDRGVGVRRLDHINFLGRAPATNSAFLQERLGAMLTELIVLDDGTQAGAWLTFTNKAYDVVYTRDETGSSGRLHHIAYWVDNREDVLRAADSYLEHGIAIEFAPGKHAIAQGFFLYTREPGGNRIEIATGSYLIFDPDWEPVVWTQADRAKGQAWGQPTIASFHTYGTPAVALSTPEEGASDGQPVEPPAGGSREP
ncbi:MAG TPA: catechol 2,3-dioxygenase [Ktedonobacterales bacterium]|jgi:catechol 2,3-dioxygenase